MWRYNFHCITIEEQNGGGHNMHKLHKPENLRGFVNIFIFMIISVFLLIGIGIYLSPECTPREIWIFLYRYYKKYFYVITVLAVSMSCFQCIQDFRSTFSEVVYKALVCMVSLILSYCICTSETLDKIAHMLQGAENNDSIRIIMGLSLTAFLTVAVAAELLAATTYYEKVKNCLCKFKYELLFFLFLSCSLLLNNTRYIDRWVTSWYAMNYQHTGNYTQSASAQ